MRIAAAIGQCERREPMELCVANETRALGIDKEITADPSSPLTLPSPGKGEGISDGDFFADSKRPGRGENG